MIFAQYRLELEIALIVAVLAMGGGWWIEHDHRLEAKGAVACEEHKTETVVQATADTAKIDQAHADQLQRVSDAFVAQISQLRSGNDDLAQRLHDLAARNAVRGSAVPKVGTPAGFVCRPADNPGLTERDRREAADLEACAANTLELIALRKAWQEQAATKQ